MVCKARLEDASLPVRGAWIEIVSSGVCPHKPARRSPCGERGLKSAPLRICSALRESLPVRGAWIEILGGGVEENNLAVAPRAGSVD